MLTESLPAHQYQSHDMPSRLCKNIILVNKQTKHSYFCDQKPINVDEQNRLCFSDLINDLKPQYPELHRAFFFVCIENREYLVGADPFTSSRYIDYSNFPDNEIIILYNEQKHHKRKDSEQIKEGATTQETPNELYIINKDSEFQKVIPSNIEEKIQKEIQKYVKPREKRVKERTIEYVIDKVKKWRDIYENGVKNEMGEIVKPNLDVAAYLVQLSRKTLDDYYAQLRKGEMYGFDFEKYKNEKMGALRKYVKEQQKTNPAQKNKGKLEEIGSKSITNPNNCNNIVEQDDSQTDQNQFINMAAGNDETNDNIESESLQLQQQQQNKINNLKLNIESIQWQQQQNDEIDLSEKITPRKYSSDLTNFNNKFKAKRQFYSQQQFQQYQQLQAQQQQDNDGMEIEEDNFSVKDEYDSIMRDQLKFTPIKSHKASFDPCDLFMDLTPQEDACFQMQ